MKTGFAKHVAGGILGGVLALTGVGCTSAAVRTTYGLDFSRVGRATPNRGDRYYVVQIRETEKGTGAERNSSALARNVQAQLEQRFPEWFSDGADTVPVIVVSRTSPPRTSYGIGSCLSSFVTGLGSLCTLGLIPCRSLVHKMDFQTMLAEEGGGETRASAYDAETLHVSALPGMLDAFWPEKAGWKRIEEKAYPAGFDLDDDNREEALCASIARLIQDLNPEERDAVRNNDEAWYWDAKLGNKRTRRVAIARAAHARDEGGERPILSSLSTHPAIIAQSWNNETRKGTLRCDVSRCEDRNVALEWVRNEYLPQYCRMLGVAISADNPGGAPAADIRIEKFETWDDGIVQIEFRIFN